MSSEKHMTGSKKGSAVAIMAALVALSFANERASAISAALANKCRAMALKTYPPKPAGSPTAHAQAQRDYFQMCVAKNGNVENDSAQKELPPRAK
jgi:hypothetical protein